MGIPSWVCGEYMGHLGLFWLLQLKVSYIDLRRLMEIRKKRSASNVK